MAHTPTEVEVTYKFVLSVQHPENEDNVVEAVRSYIADTKHALDSPVAVVVLSENGSYEIDSVRVIFDLDENGEANGTVHSFCSDECREAYIPEGEGIPSIEYGRSSVDDFGFLPGCEQCGQFVPHVHRYASHRDAGVVGGVRLVCDCGHDPSKGGGL